MTTTDLIKKIENFYNNGTTIQPAPVVPDALTGLVAFKENCPKYAIDESGQLIGLNLAKTDLNNNKWDKIAALLAQESVVLQALNLSDNALVNVEMPFGASALKMLYVDGNPLDNLPREIVEQGNEGILNFLQQIEEQGGETVPLFEAKLLIVGEPDAGKTTLLKKLKDPTYIVAPDGDKTVKSTIGIDIFEDFTFPFCGEEDVEFKANVWDFGGQNIQYMTHHFFLTPRALYVIVANDRKQNTAFNYWFRIIDLLGREKEEEKISVLVVLNEINHVSVTNFDINKYREDYPKINIEVCELDFSKDDHRSQGIVPQIQRMLCALPHIKDELPALWKPIREDLFAKREKKDHIRFSDFAAICQQERQGKKMEKEEDQRSLSRYLHILGVLLHYQEEDDLDNFIILRPQWAVDAVYSVLKDTRVKQNNGRFTKEDLKDFWIAYSSEERSSLLRMMLKDKFEVCYQVPHSSVFIAPQLLSGSQPKVAWNSEQTLKFRFQYKFMPKGLISRLIVRLSDDISDNGNLVWKKGVFIDGPDCQARIVQEENIKSGLKILEIEINGKEQKRIILLDSIIKEVERIHEKSFKNIRFSKMIPCNCPDCKNSATPTFFEYSELLRYEAEEVPGFDVINCTHIKLKKVSVKGLLEGVFKRMEKVGISQIKNWIASGKVDKAVKEIAASFQDNNDLINLTAQWNILKQSVNIGILTQAEGDAKKAKIIQGLLRFLGQ